MKDLVPALYLIALIVVSGLVAVTKNFIFELILIFLLALWFGFWFYMLIKAFFTDWTPQHWKDYYAKQKLSHKNSSGAE